MRSPWAEHWTTIAIPVSALKGANTNLDLTAIRFVHLWSGAISNRGDVYLDNLEFRSF